MGKLRIYRVKEEYVKYLKGFDNKVDNHEDDKSIRPYIGVVVNIDNDKYYAPLTSPKEKHKKMNDNIDFIKIKKGRYGAINLNNMIPIIESELIDIDINNFEDESYKEILVNQAVFIRKNSQRIQESAEELYKRVVIEKSEKDKKLIDRCCDFSLLAEKSKLYEQKLKSIEDLAKEVNEKILENKEIEQNV